MAVGLPTEINVTGAISAGLSWSFADKRLAGYNVAESPVAAGPFFTTGRTSDE